MTMTRRRPKPQLPHEDLARRAKFAKPQYGAEPEETDTRELKFRKIHPDRDPEYGKWLRFQDCSIKGKTDALTDQPHVCWSPEYRPTRFLSDAAHTGKSYSGRLKRSDVPSECASGQFSLCRHAHRLQEDQMNAFDERFGIDRHEIAKRQHAQYLAEQERRR